MARTALLAVAAGILGCTSMPPREAAIVAAIVEADEPHLRTRPRLTEGKYARMARDLYSYYRGALPVFRADFRDPSTRVGVTRFPSGGPLPLALGDPHPENFGLLEAGDRSLALEPNDLDATDRYPYHWDLRRLTVGLVLACRLGNRGDEAARAALVAVERDVVRAAAESYAAAIATDARERVTAGGDAALVTDLFRRGARDRGPPPAELGELTTIVDGARRLRRGVLDGADPEEALHDLPTTAIATIPDALARYRGTLGEPPAPEALTVLDAARQVGSGVASWPRVRVLVLVRGPTDDPGDDVVLEIKEQLESGIDEWSPAGTTSDDVVDRTLDARAAWAIGGADPLWGASEWLGVPVQIRREAESQKTLRVERMEGDEGTPAATIALARVLATIVARVHATPVAGAEHARAAIASAIDRDRAAFVEDEIAIAIAYADRVALDWELFRDALRRLGPTLGLVADESDRAPSDLRAVLGDPEPVRPWE